MPEVSGAEAERDEVDGRCGGASDGYGTSYCHCHFSNDFLASSFFLFLSTFFLLLLLSSLAFFLLHLLFFLPFILSFFPPFPPPYPPVFLLSHHLNPPPATTTKTPLSQKEKQNRNKLNHTKDRQENAIYAFTIVTAIFLPLSAVASIFGMNSSDVRDMSLGQWAYWVTAVPVTLMVLLLGLWFTGELGVLLRWLGGFTFGGGVGGGGWVGGRGGGKGGRGGRGGGYVGDGEGKVDVVVVGDDGDCDGDGEEGGVGRARGERGWRMAREVRKRRRVD